MNWQKHMKRKHIYIILVLIFAAALSYNQGKATEARPQEINVFAAASLTEAVSEIAEGFEEENNGQVKVSCNFAGSGALSMQIEEGAACGVFISAAKADMDKLETANLVSKATRIDLLGNSLTLIASEEAKDFVSLETLGQDEIKTIAIGTPEAVPAGTYAVQALAALGINEEIEKKLILTKDVRSVVDYVETGNADCGFVYKTDAMLLKSGKIVQTLPENTHEPIVYPMALIAQRDNKTGETSADMKKTAIAFYEYLQGEYAKSVFEKYGFTVL